MPDKFVLLSPKTEATRLHAAKTAARHTQMHGRQHHMLITKMQCVQQDIPEIHKEPTETLNVSHMHLHPCHYTTVPLQGSVVLRASSYHIAALFQRIRADPAIYCSLMCCNDSTCQRAEVVICLQNVFLRLSALKLLLCEACLEPKKSLSHCIKL